MNFMNTSKKKPFSGLHTLNFYSIFKSGTKSGTLANPYIQKSPILCQHRVRELLKSLIISLTISIILSIAVQDAAQNISDNIQLKYTDSSKLYEYQNGYSQLFGDVPQIPDVSPEIMTPSDRIAKELCDFISSWCILFFTLFGVFLSLTLFYKRRLKTPFSVLNEAADKISRQDLDFKISYVYDDELGQICAAFEKMREKLAENNNSMWNMIDEQKQMRSAFSHDLRTPLAVMKGYVEYLLRYYPKHRLSEEKVIEVLGELQSQTERISCFAYTMKNINRLDEIIISRAYVSQADLLAKTEAILTVLAQKYAKQFEVHSELKEQQLNLDISIFLEVLENLIDNAMRFSVQCVRVEFRYSQSLLNVCVHDDGKGFQPDELSKAVKPYYHGESVGTEHYGMGLYICKMLCEKHGGFLRVYNSPGGGACVEFNIAA